MNAFDVFINNISSYPTIIFTGMVMFVTLFWLISAVGAADMDVLDLGDADFGEGGDLSSIGFFSGIMLKFGLHGVPLIFILTGISLIGWILSYMYTSFLHANFATGILHYVFGTGAFIVVLVASMFLTGLMITPIRKKMSTRPKKNAQSLIGKTAIVRTFTVNARHGEAALEDGGAGLILKVRAIDGEFKQHDKVVLAEYVADENSYLVVAESDYMG